MTWLKKVSDVLKAKMANSMVATIAIAMLLTFVVSILGIAASPHEVLARSPTLPLPPPGLH